MAAGDLTTLANVKEWLGISGLPIASITQANPAVVTVTTAPQLPLLSGFSYSISGASGMVIDGTYVITKLSQLSFSIPVDATLLGAYTGGAVVGVSDSLLSRMIAACSAYIQTYIDRVIAVQGYAEVRNGMDMDRMMMKNTPIVSVASLAIGGISIPVRPPLGPGATSLPGGYVFDDQMIYLSGYRFCRGAQNVLVQYSAGYAVTPPDIEQACIDMIGDWFKYRDRIGKVSDGIEGQTISFVNADIPARTKVVLLTYKRVSPVY